jgi:hypothetical protein
MVNPVIYEKTEAGAEEVKARSRKLAPRLRTMLIMVDGMISATQLQDAAASLGAPNDFLDSLLQQGLIRRRAAAQAAEDSIDVVLDAPAAPAWPEPPTDGERFRSAQKFMNDSAVDAMGLRAFFFTLKLEKCFTVDDLRALLPEYTKVVTKGSGDGVARVLSRRARDMLG